MNMARATYAFDKKSARSFDADGRMRVVDCVLSVAEVNPYFGREIPRNRELGLQPDRVYDLYRDPDALAAAAPSFDGLALMIRHVAQTADEPRKEYIGGSVYNVRFEDGRLRGDLLVWDRAAIDLIQSGVLADLSSSYRYTPDMTPGEVAGRAYDGVMRNIEGNHVALVEDGRATGAHVADSAIPLPEEPNMTDKDKTAADNAPDNAQVAEALLKLAERLDGIEARLERAEAGRANDSDPDTDETDDPANDETPDTDKADDETPDPDKAMDAASVQALVQAAVQAERERAASVERAKNETRHVLGDMIAMDSAADIYRAALQERGVDVASIAPGTEQVAWQAYTAAARAPAPLAMDSAPGNAGKPRFDTARLRVRG